MIQPSFYHRELQDMVPKFLSKAELLVQRWNTLLEQNNGKLRVDITAEMTLLTLDVLSSTMFGYDLNGLSAIQDTNSERAELLSAFNEVLGYFDVKPQQLIPSYVKYVPTPENIRFKKNLSKVREILYRIIEEKRNSLDPDAKGKVAIHHFLRIQSGRAYACLVQY
jgi:cytochrome P450